MTNLNFLSNPIKVIFIPSSTLSLPVKHKAWKIKIRNGKGLTNFFRTGSYIQHMFYKDDITDILYTAIMLNNHENIDYTPFLDFYKISDEWSTIYDRDSGNVATNYPLLFTAKIGNISIHGLQRSHYSLFLHDLTRFARYRLKVMYNPNKSVTENLNRILSFLLITYGDCNIKLFTSE